MKPTPPTERKPPPRPQAKPPPGSQSPPLSTPVSRSTTPSSPLAQQPPPSWKPLPLVTPHDAHPPTKTSPLAAPPPSAQTPPPPTKAFPPKATSTSKQKDRPNIKDTTKRLPPTLTLPSANTPNAPSSSKTTSPPNKLSKPSAPQSCKTTHPTSTPRLSKPHPSHSKTPTPPHTPPHNPPLLPALSYHCNPQSHPPTGSTAPPLQSPLSYDYSLKGLHFQPSTILNNNSPLSKALAYDCAPKTPHLQSSTIWNVTPLSKALSYDCTPQRPHSQPSAISKTQRIAKTPPRPNPPPIKPPEQLKSDKNRNCPTDLINSRSSLLLKSHSKQNVAKVSSSSLCPQIKKSSSKDQQKKQHQLRSSPPGSKRRLVRKRSISSLQCRSRQPSPLESRQFLNQNRNQTAKTALVQSQPKGGSNLSSPWSSLTKVVFSGRPNFGIINSEAKELIFGGEPSLKAKVAPASQSSVLQAQPKSPSVHTSQSALPAHNFLSMTPKQSSFQPITDAVYMKDVQNIQQPRSCAIKEESHLLVVPVATYRHYLHTERLSKQYRQKTNYCKNCHRRGDSCSCLVQEEITIVRPTSLAQAQAKPHVLVSAPPPPQRQLQQQQQPPEQAQAQGFPPSRAQLEPPSQVHAQLNSLHTAQSQLPTKAPQIPPKPHAPSRSALFPSSTHAKSSFLNLGQPKPPAQSQRLSFAPFITSLQLPQQPGRDPLSARLTPTGASLGTAFKFNKTIVSKRLNK